MKIKAYKPLLIQREFVYYLFNIQINSTHKSKMKKITLLSSLAVFILISCSSNDSATTPVTPTVADPQSYFFKYMDYPSDMALDPNADNIIQLIYDSDNKITKRVGGYKFLAPGAGISTMYSNLYYDDVNYSNNEIHIVRKLNSTIYTTSPFERILTLDSQNRIIKKTTFKQQSYPEYDTINYTYNNLGLISGSIMGNLNGYNEIANYYYNQNRNLDSIVTKKQYQNDPFYSKEKQIFSNYDTALNPLGKLIIFEETFFRAISQNNYAKYEKYTYNSDNTLINQEIRIWNLHYDNSGNVRFEQY